MDFAQAATDHVDGMLVRAVKKSSSLPDSSYVCFKEQSECMYDQSSEFSIAQYSQVRARNVPVLGHPTYHEGGKAFIFDLDTNKIIEVLDWGA